MQILIFIMAIYLSFKFFSKYTISIKKRNPIEERKINNFTRKDMALSEALEKFNRKH